MSKGDAVRGLIAATIEKFGRLDILVNNAGIQFTAPVEEFPVGQVGCDPGDQSVGGIPRHRDRSAPDEKAALGTDRQHRLHPRPRRVDAQGRLRRGQARVGRLDQGGRSRDRRQRRDLQRSLPRLGANASWSKSRSATSLHRRGISQKHAAEDTPGREATVVSSSSLRSSLEAPWPSCVRPRRTRSRAPRSPSTAAGRRSSRR